MDDFEDILCRDKLMALAQEVASEVSAGLKAGTLRKTIQRSILWKPTEFSYGENGVETAAKSPHVLHKQSWGQAIFSLQGTLSMSKAYDEAFAACKGLWHGRWDLSWGFRHFVRGLTQHIVEEGAGTGPSIKGLIDKYVGELLGHPQAYHAQVCIQGIVVSPKAVEFSSCGMDVKIRQVLAEDLQEEVPVDERATGFPPTSTPVYGLPTAVLEISGEASDANEASFTVWRSLVLLSLFRVGSVRYLWYGMNGEWTNDIWGEGVRSTSESFGGEERYTLLDTDSRMLQRFWDSVWPSIPEPFYWNEGGSAHSALINAHDRYLDGLKHDPLLERRIAHAVMGLESLLLRGRGALAYQFRMLGARLLGSIAGDPDSTRRTLGDAYTVRSVFLHGGRLKGKAARRICRKYGSLEKLATKTLDCLRHVILIFLSAGREKGEVCDLIEGAMVGSQGQVALDALLSEYQSWLTPDADDAPGADSRG